MDLILITLLTAAVSVIRPEKAKGHINLIPEAEYNILSRLGLLSQKYLIAHLAYFDGRTSFSPHQISSRD